MHTERQVIRTGTLSISMWLKQYCGVYSKWCILTTSQIIKNGSQYRNHLNQFHKETFFTKQLDIYKLVITEITRCEVLYRSSYPSLPPKYESLPNTPKKRPVIEIFLVTVA